MGTVRFVLDGAIQEVAVSDPTATLLDHLRYKLGRTGTKEGCSDQSTSPRASWYSRLECVAIKRA